MPELQKLAKLIERMEALVTYLNDRSDLVAHQQVNQFFYMQKIEELQTLLHQFNEATERVEMLAFRIDQTYSLCFAQWQRDARWLNSYRRRETKCRG